jgi:RNA polymerase sigma factor (sigma-70 family)
MNTNQLIADGDNDAIQAAYSLYWVPLVNALRKFGDMAEDLAQEAFIALPQAIKPDSDILRLLKLIGRRRGIDAKRLKSLPILPNLVSCDTVLVPINYVKSPEAGPLDMALLSEQIDNLYAMISKLPDQQRKVVELYFLKDMTGNEVAEELGVSRDCVKSHADIALKSLRKHAKNI